LHGRPRHSVRGRKCCRGEKGKKGNHTKQLFTVEGAVPLARETKGAREEKKTENN